MTNNSNLPEARFDRAALDVVAKNLGEETLSPEVAAIMTKNRAIYAVSVLVHAGGKYASAKTPAAKAKARAATLADLDTITRHPGGAKGHPIASAYGKALEIINGKEASAAQKTNGRAAFALAVRAFAGEAELLDVLCRYSMPALNAAGVALLDGGDVTAAIDAANSKTDQENTTRAERENKADAAADAESAKMTKADLIVAMDKARSLIDAVLTPRKGLTLDADAQRDLDAAAEVLSKAISAGQ